MKKFGIVVSRFNEMITEKMLTECKRGFEEQGITAEVVKVPGAAEIPIAAQELIRNKNVNTIVALGLIVKGETDHYDMVCSMCREGVLEVSLKHHVPIIFEVLMTDSYQKAESRIEKAYHAAFHATEMSDLISQ